MLVRTLVTFALVAVGCAAEPTVKLRIDFSNCPGSCSDVALSCVGAVDARLLAATDAGEQELSRRCVSPLPVDVRTACDLLKPDLAVLLFGDVKAPVRGAVVEVALKRELPGIDACEGGGPLALMTARSAPFDVDGQSKDVALSFPRCMSCSSDGPRCDGGTPCTPLLMCPDGGVPRIRQGECCPSC